MSLHLEKEAAFETGLVGFLYRQFFRHRTSIPATTSLASQTAIVTGSNGGLGFEAARQLLQLGLSTLIIAVRSQAKGDAAAKTLREAAPEARIEVWLLDMEKYDSIRDFAKKCETLDRIDIVIVNAGVQNEQYKVVEATGHEQTIQVNYLSTALLTILLLPVLKAKASPAAAKPPIISIVSSDTAYWQKIENHGPVIAAFDKAEGFAGMTQYQFTKLLEMMFVVKLATLVSADDVVINLCNPGWTTGTALNNDIKNVVIATFKALVGRNLEVGASTYVDATVVQGKESHGSFCSDWALRPFPPIMYTSDGQEIRERLWEETMEELNFAGASQVVQGMRK